MAALSIRNLDDAIVARLKRRAARHGQSAEAEARAILRQALSEEPDAGFEDLAAKLRKMSARRKHTPAEQLVREGRNER